MAHIFDENSEFKRYLKNEGKYVPNVQHTNLEQDLAAGKLEKPIELNIDASSHHNVHHTVDTVDPYKLDLSSAKLKKTLEPSPTPILADLSPQKAVEPSPKSTKDSRLHDFFVEHLRTLFYFVIFFVGGYLILNLPAYYEVGKNLYFDITGKEQNPVLRTFTADSDQVVSTEAVAASLPPFSLEVTPPGTRIIIPTLDKNVPVVSVPEDNLVKRDWQGLERDLQNALRGGVVHYPGTPWPGQSGNVVLTGHSSYYPWDPGRFKDVFAILHNVKLNDEIVIFHNQRKYRYKVTETKVVLPEQVEVLGDTGDDRLTLLTCTPIGTNLKRLIVTAKPVSEN
jgi:LPXTG-site transpeptidase (sortase) family protein